MLSYPPPEENPLCQCKDNPMKQMFCPCGHMTECHAGYSCSQAGCTHLFKYDLPPEEVACLEHKARLLLAAGKMPPYQMDADGNVMVVPKE